MQGRKKEVMILSAKAETNMERVRLDTNVVKGILNRKMHSNYAEATRSFGGRFYLIETTKLQS